MKIDGEPVDHSLLVK